MSGARTVTVRARKVESAKGRRQEREDWIRAEPEGERKSQLGILGTSAAKCAP